MGRRKNKNNFYQDDIVVNSNTRNYNNYQKYKTTLKVPELPIEIWLQILRYANFKSPLGMRRVCKTWKSCLEELVTTFTTARPEVLLKVCPNVSTLIITRLKMYQTVSQLQNVRKLTLHNIPPAPMELHNLPLLRSLRLTGNTVYGCPFFILGEVIKSKTIESLTFGDNYECCFSCSNLYRSIQVKKIKLLRIKGIFLSHLEGIKNLNKVTKISIISCNIIVQPITFIETLFISFSLERIIISKSSIGNENTEIIIKNHFPALNVLSSDQRLVISLKSPMLKIYSEQ